MLNIETTNACNLECPMCARTTSMTRPVQDMRMDVFRKIIDQAAEHGVRAVNMHFLGEPLLAPGIFDMIEYAKRFPAIQSVALSTNVTPLNERNADRLLESGLDSVILAIDAVSEEIYTAVRGLDFSRVLANARRFLSMHRERRSRMRVAITIINMRMKQHELDSFRAEWAEFESEQVKILVKQLTNFGGLVNLTKLGELQRDDTGETRVPCRKIRQSLTITSAGEVIACCYDANATMSYGNLRDTGLKEIWEGEAIRKLREKHQVLDFSGLPLCVNCDATRATLT